MCPSLLFRVLLPPQIYPPCLWILILCQASLMGGIHLDIRPASNTGAMLIRLITLFAFLLALTATGWSSDMPVPTIKINIHVLDEKQQPLAQAQVEISFQAKIVASILTDESGEATVPIPAPDHYFLRITKKDYIANEVTLEITPEIGTQKIEVTLSHIALSKQQITVQATAANPVEEQPSG